MTTPVAGFLRVVGDEPGAVDHFEFGQRHAAPEGRIDNANFSEGALRSKFFLVG